MKNLLTNEMKNFENDILQRLTLFKTDTLLLWGENDELVHYSGASLLSGRLPNCHVKILDKCGHLIEIDQPMKTAEHLIKFFRRHTRPYENHILDY